MIVVTAVPENRELHPENQTRGIGRRVNWQTG